MKQRNERNNLSPREEEVLRLASSGLTDQQIANTLGIRVSTVTTYWIRIRSKIGQLNRAELIAHSVRQRSQETLRELREEVRRLRSENRELCTKLGMSEQLAATARHVLDQIPLAVLVVDAEGLVKLANDRGSELMGCTPTEECARLSDIIPEPALRELRRGPQKVTLRRPDGKEQVACAELHTIDGDPAWTTCLIQAE